MDNSTLAGITNIVRKDLSSKVTLGTHYDTPRSKWYTSSNKFTKFEIFSSVLAVKKMMEYTVGEGCDDDGDFLSWEDMQWNLHGEAKIEHIEAEETYAMQSFNFYAAGFDSMILNS